ncbi:MAG TPA: hypothetical protein VMW45_03760 [Dehalococcoidia bacterium]|nr:hypothetical protein [Dehalococcoidia bacterium]
MKPIKVTIRNVDEETYNKARQLSIKLKVGIGFLVTEGLKKVIKENA